MMRNAYMTIIALATLLLAGCAPSTFIVTKDGCSTYFGRMNTGVGRRLCSSGDLRRVLDAANIAQIAKDGFYRYICTEEYSRETVLSIYQFLSPDEKQELMRTFNKFGYEVNLVRC